MSEQDRRRQFSFSASDVEVERADELAEAMKRSRSDLFRVLVDEKRIEVGLDPAPAYTLQK